MMKKYIEVNQEEWLKAPVQKRRTRYKTKDIEIKPLAGIIYNERK